MPLRVNACVLELPPTRYDPHGVLLHRPAINSTLVLAACVRGCWIEISALDGSAPTDMTDPDETPKD